MPRLLDHAPLQPNPNYQLNLDEHANNDVTFQLYTVSATGQETLVGVSMGTALPLVASTASAANVLVNNKFWSDSTFATRF